MDTQIDGFVSQKTWRSKRPRTLVVACSDGRLQDCLDDFLHERLGIYDYDRLYSPGGGGALAMGGGEFIRADQYRRDLALLMTAHGTEEVLLFFHGAAEDGPADAVCAHYRRIKPYAGRDELLRQQEEDAREVLRHAFREFQNVSVRVFRAEVDAKGEVQFTEMMV